MCTLARSPSRRSATILTSPVAKTSSGILRLVSKRLPGSVILPRDARQLHLEHAVVGGQHDEAALGAGHFDRGVEHERQHFVEHAARAERAQAFEQRRQLPDVADRRLLVPFGRRRRRRGVFDQEHDVGAGGAAELDAIAVPQRTLGRNLLAVDERAVAGTAIAQDVSCRWPARSRRDRATRRCPRGARRSRRGGRWRSAACRAARHGCPARR